MILFLDILRHISNNLWVIRLIIEEEWSSIACNREVCVTFENNSSFISLWYFDLARYCKFFPVSCEWLSPFNWYSMVAAGCSISIFLFRVCGMILRKYVYIRQVYNWKMTRLFPRYYCVPCYIHIKMSAEHALPLQSLQNETNTNILTTSSYHNLNI